MKSLLQFKMATKVDCELIRSLWIFNLMVKISIYTSTSKENTNKFLHNVMGKFHFTSIAYHFPKYLKIFKIIKCTPNPPPLHINTVFNLISSFSPPITTIVDWVNRITCAHFQPKWSDVFAMALFHWQC